MGPSSPAVAVQPPLRMDAFFAKSAGTWLSQRAVHHFDAAEDESGESNLIVSLLPHEDASVARVCEQLGLPLAAATCGARFNWQDTFRQGPPDEKYSAVLVDLPDTDNPLRGRLMRDVGYVEARPVISRYQFSCDGVLSIHTDYDRNTGVERCWFINDDVRVRVGSVRLMDGPSLMSYCTEIRCSPDADFAALRQASLARC